MTSVIAVDAMGGDNAPEEVVQGAMIAANQLSNIKLLLIGNKKAIEEELGKRDIPFIFDIIHTDEIIMMDENPKIAIKSKPNASINIGAKLGNDEKIDALVSAGNTGALILAAATHIPLIEGIERAALATIYPTAKSESHKSNFSLMLDVGATLKCTTKQLVHFAFMGNSYLSDIFGINKPTIGLLNIGEEDTKGGEVLMNTFKLLKKSKELNFIGNIEGKDIPRGIADIVVTEGFTGNVVLKMLEGFGDVIKETARYAFKKKLTWKIAMTLVAPTLKKIKQTIDYSEYGGAPLLGFKKLIIKAHGRSNAKAIANAIRVAAISSEQKISQKIENTISKFNLKYALDFSEI
jgi:glycerol-3-phosphate acyltransferase PlsX